MDKPLYVVYLDRHRFDDLLFVESLARVMGRARQARPACIFVHGSTEREERAVEGQGGTVAYSGTRLLVCGEAEAALVARSLRETLRQLVGTFTDAGVPAVGFLGTDRALLLIEAEDIVTAGRVAWLADLARRGAVPWVTALVPGTGAPREVDALSAALALAAATGATLVLLSDVREAAAVAGVAAAVPLESPLVAAAVPDSGVRRRLAGVPVPVLLVHPEGLSGADSVAGLPVVT